MNVAISGSRGVWASDDELAEGLQSVNAKNCWLLIGDCPTGIDKQATELVTQAEGNVRVFVADWDKHGKAAGPIRNQQMIDQADMLIAFPCPKSKGTWDSIRKAVKKGIKVVIVPVGVDRAE